MRAFFATVLSVIAAGVLLIAYGLLAPRASASPQVVYDPQTGSYQLARPMLVHERVAAPEAGLYGYQAASPVPYATPVGYTQAVYTTPVAQPRYVETPAPRVVQAPRAQRTVTRVDQPGRNWKKTALVIGGSTATGAGVGALVGGKKGALIGAAIGGGASTLYEAKRTKN
jgi:hypothetical protein